MHSYILIQILQLFQDNHKEGTDDNTGEDDTVEKFCPCDHEDLASFFELGRGYFVETYVKDNFPTNCASCNVKFIVGKPKDSSEVAVTDTKSVKACRNATLDSNHLCTYALCVKCYGQQIVAIMDRKQAEEKEAKARARLARHLYKPNSTSRKRGNNEASSSPSKKKTV